MNIISFTVPGKPVPKGRARSFVRNGKIGHFTPKETVIYENAVKLAASKAMNSLPPFTGPASLNVNVYIKIPESWSLTKKAEANGGLIRPTSRPDLDNILKSIKDGMNGIVWKDDSQVVQVLASKWYSDIACVRVSAGELER